MFGSFLPSLRSSINHSLLGSRSRHCYAIIFGISQILAGVAPCRGAYMIEHLGGRAADFLLQLVLCGLSCVSWSNATRQGQRSLQAAGLSVVSGFRCESILRPNW